ncbi:hypothetical protein FIC_00457 [Flavobacteriaceae bacterium 3519-10]|nr:hypothetical protein FIC_00457 [Flavobacteriaceae bacterium 3519-10]
MGYFISNKEEILFWFSLDILLAMPKSMKLLMR